MLSFGAFAFAAPWALVALAGLPILWWLLRVTPPAPRLLRFPAIRLLFGLRQDEQTPARTPLWLILLRMTIATLVILGLARPVLNPANQFDAPGPLMLVIDDGWAAARGWTQRTAAVEALLARAQRAEKPVIILTTAEPDTGGPLSPSKLLTAGAARSMIQALQPKPWPTARAKALEVLKELKLETQANVVWVADGVDDGSAKDFVNRLTFFGPVTVMGDAPGSGALVLPPPNTASAQLKGRLLRVQGGESEEFWVRGLDDRGRVLLRERIAFTAGARSAEQILSLPPELRNRLTRLEVEGVASAATVALFDERWRRRPVGIVTATTDKAQTRPLLSEIFYLDRALGPYAELRKGPVTTLLSRRLAVLVIADGSILTPGDRETIQGWMARGGTVLRFAGPRLVQKPDELTPVALRAGNRALGGAMSWTVPARLAPFSASSPFAGIPVPKDVLVSRQVLAQPALDLPNRTWARLADGTPLITAAEKGRGRLILVHTTANTEWSNLALSGLYVELMRRVVSLSQGVSGARNQALPPVTSLDGFGRYTDPPAAAQPLPADTEDSAAVKPGDKPAPVRLGPTRPPGFYGNDAARFAVNLGDGMTRLTPIGDMPAGVRALELTAPEETDLKAVLLAIALALLIIDLWAGLILRGLAPEFWPFLRRPGEGHVARAEEAGAQALAIFAAAALLALATAGPVQAQDQRPSAPRVTERQAMDATFDTRLAYVLTGDSRVDEVSRSGLRGLSRTLRMRTSVEPKAPIGVDVERDELNFFPLLYWPVTAAQPLPSRAARDKLARYLRTGGMIMFDTRDQGSGSLGTPGGLAPSGPGAAKLRQIVSGLPVPALIPVPNTHILTKAFYLLKEFPGRWTGGRLWVEKEAGQDNDGVSSVIIGSNDFASAWAVDGGGQPLYPVVPGGSRQREMAYRFGVNLVMYALTGNYKSDQVHVPAILERLGQ
jgi:hypothetical protein